MEIKQSRSITVLVAILMAIAVSVSAQTDTIPPPPPGISDTIAGPLFVCTGDTAIYSIDVPIGCECQWTVNGEPQATVNCMLSFIPAAPGVLTVEATVVCNGITNPATYHYTTVTAAPEVYLGADTSISQGQTVILDAGNPGSSYLWSTGDTTQTIEVSEPGNYSVTVTNECGSSFDEISVSVITAVSSTAYPLPAGMYIIDHVLCVDNMTGLEQFSIFNALGQLIYHGPARDKIRLPGAGLYLVRIRDENSLMTLKLVSR